MKQLLGTQKLIMIKKISYKEFVKKQLGILQSAKRPRKVAENMVMKIQGLKIMHFFITNKKDLSAIMNKMINGAKKVSDTNGFFIKIY